jgi:acetyl esterase
VAIEAARHGWPCAVQLLVYPATSIRRETRSAELFAHGFYLTREFMERADEFYAAGVPTDDPRLSPMHAELPQGLAPALVHTAGFDPLRDEGEAYADRLRDVGVDVTLTRFDDQIHGFLNIVGVGRTSRAANRQIARELAAALA